MEQQSLFMKIGSLQSVDPIVSQLYVIPDRILFNNDMFRRCVLPKQYGIKKMDHISSGMRIHIRPVPEADLCRC